MASHTGLITEYTQKSIVEGKRLWGVVTSPSRVLPDFLIIGAQKGGTTSLYNYLIQHPGVTPALKKEVHFFDNNFARGARWYKSHFPRRSEVHDAGAAGATRLLTGESSPYYLFHPLAPERAFETVPATKLIVMLRHPVERALSHHQHNVRKRDEALPFSEALEQEEERLAGEEQRLIRGEVSRSRRHQNFSYRARGAYLDQLERWTRFFRREQLLVLSSEAFYRNTQTSLNDVTDFLDLPRFIWKSYERHNSGGGYKRMDALLRQQLLAHFEPHNRRLEDYLGVTFGWDH